MPIYFVLDVSLQQSGSRYSFLLQAPKIKDDSILFIPFALSRHISIDFHHHFLTDMKTPLNQRRINKTEKCA